MKKVMPYIGVAVAILVAAFVVFAVVKTGKLPISVKETYSIPKGGQLTLVESGKGGTALKVKIDLGVMTNLVSGLPLEEDCWLVFGAEPKQDTNALVRVEQ